MDVRFYLLLFIIITAYWGNTQTRDTSFIKVYSGSGYDYSRDIIQTTDSNFVITGSSSSFPSENADVLLMKVGHYGNLTWSSSYGGSGDDWGTKVSELSDSSLIVSGYTNSFGQGGFDFYLLKTDSVGTLKWSRTFGGFNWDLSHSHVIAENEDIILVGETQSFGNGNKDIMLVRTDSIGNEKWRKFYGGTGDDIAYDIAHDSADSTLYVVGSTTKNMDNQQAYILKLDYNGDTIFTHTTGGSFEDAFLSTVLDMNNDLVSVGYHGIDTTNQNFWFFSLDKVEDTINYDVKDGGNDIDKAYSNDFSTLTNDLLYGGSTTSYGLGPIEGSPDLWLGNRISDGDWLDYYNNFGDVGNDDIRSIKWLKQGGIAAVGNTEFFSESENGIIFIRINLIKDYPQFNGSNNNINSSVNVYVVPENFSIHPNPFDEQIIIELQEVQSNTKASIYSLDGKLMDEYELNNYQNTISTGEWKKGFYLVRFTINGQYSGTYKLMK